MAAGSPENAWNVRAAAIVSGVDGAGGGVWRRGLFWKSVAGGPEYKQRNRFAQPGLARAGRTLREPAAGRGAPARRARGTIPRVST
jgi:hypothetical protein